MNKQYFARNADGTIKTKQACETPGCNYPNYHVCLGPMQVVLTADGPLRKRGSTSTFLEKHAADPTFRQKISEAVSARHAARRARENEINFERDEMVIRDFDMGHSKAQIQKKYGIHHHKLRAILERRDQFVTA